MGKGPAKTTTKRGGGKKADKGQAGIPALPVRDAGLLNRLDVKAELTESGIKGSTNSRTIIAADTLVGSAGLWLRDAIERSRERRDLKHSIDMEIKKIEGAAKINSTKTSLLNLYVRDQSKQENREEVLAIAYEELKASAAQDQEPEEPGDLNPDWLNFLGAYAEKATTENTRKLWGAVLAGEIRKPGTFSLATLRFIAELDQTIAQLYQKYAEQRFNGMIFSPGELSGDALTELSMLQEAGLLSHVGGFLNYNVPPLEPDGYCYISDGQIIPGALFLRVKPINKDDRGAISMIRLSRVAQEIAQLLPKASAESVMRAVVAKVEGKMEEIWLCRVIRIEPNAFEWIVVDRIKHPLPQ